MFIDVIDVFTFHETSMYNSGIRSNVHQSYEWFYQVPNVDQAYLINLEQTRCRIRSPPS